MFRSNTLLAGKIAACTWLFFLPVLVFAADRPLSPLANTDETYQKLRQLTLDDAVTVQDLEIRRDVARMRLNGTISFGQAVDGRRPLAVFTGEGELIFEPSLPLEQRNLSLYTGGTSIREPFGSAVFWFTDDTEAEIRQAGSPASVDSRAAEALQRLRSRVRTRDKRPRSQMEAMLHGEDMDNVEAVMLGALAHGSEEGVFLAYLNGKKYDDLRFFLRPAGALPQMLSPEEVALLNVRFGADDEGVW